MRQRLFLYFVVVLCFCAALYGASYQQFRHFDRTDPRGANDSKSYLAMSHGDYDTPPPIHRYRFVIPAMARAMRIPLARVVRDNDTLETLPFYLINFTFVLASSMLLWLLLLRLGFDSRLAILGVLIFLTSRMTVITTACPLVDSFFLFSVMTILVLTLEQRIAWLALTMPLLATSKETIVPFLFFPLFTKKARTSIGYWISLVVSFGVILLVRYVVSHSTATMGDEVGSIAEDHFVRFLHSLAKLPTPRGVHDLQNGFSFFLLLAVLGFFINRKHKLHAIPIMLNAMIPIALFYALLSANLGRMFFISFPVVIPYALICLEYALRQCPDQCKSTAADTAGVATPPRGDTPP